MKNLAQKQEVYTIEEYLAWERLAETRSEYYDGAIVAMAGGSRRHSLLAANVIRRLGEALDPTDCDVYTSDLKVKVGPSHFFYPDVTVLCGEPDYYDGEHDAVTNPKLIVEVLSPSTEAGDRGVKWLRLQRLQSLTDYLLVAQDSPRIDHFFRDSEGHWCHHVLTGLDAMLSIESLGCEIKFNEIYRRVFVGEETAA